jgi:predicted  nucleic acid-binding Zn-ribbon protein
MAWYRNHYHCGDCGTDWQDEWSCCCDDECPECGSRHWSPVESEDLTEVVIANTSSFVVMRSPAHADDKPRYFPLAAFASATDAERFKTTGELT